MELEKEEKNMIKQNLELFLRKNRQNPSKELRKAIKIYNDLLNKE